MHPNPFLKNLSLIHYSLCGGLLLFMAFAYFQTENFNVRTEEGDIFIYIVPVLAMAGYFSSKYMYQHFKRNIDKEESLKTKLSRYQVSLLIGYALIEGPAFLALVAYFMNGTALYLVIAFALMLYLFAQRPSLERLFREVPLSFEEKKQFDTLKG